MASLVEVAVERSGPRPRLRYASLVFPALILAIGVFQLSTIRDGHVLLADLETVAKQDAL